ncbi:MAG: 30S ribosomal protein S3 [Clostridia bacterium]|nr:30S ribosomal protein S3 [Clostridia bacterium]
MGQKVNPHGLRVGVNTGWNSQWYASNKDFSKYLLEDRKIRDFIKKNYKNFGISKVNIDRSVDKTVVSVYTSRPGLVIGQKGAGVETLKAQLAKISAAKNVVVNVMEIKSPDFDAQLVAESIASQLENRVGFRRAMKQALNRCTKAGVQGIKIMVGGRLDGAEIARSEFYQEGSLPLQTLRADIDYGFAEAHIYGKLGVKVWIYKGEILGKKNLTNAQGGNTHVDA